MNIIINGAPKSIAVGTTIDSLLTLLNIKRSFLAVELNESIVSREQYQHTLLKEDDRLEIVTLVGGG